MTKSSVADDLVEGFREVRAWADGRDSGIEVLAPKRRDDRRNTGEGIRPDELMTLRELVDRLGATELHALVRLLSR